MHGKLDSTENPRSFEKYLTPPKYQLALQLQHFFENGVPRPRTTHKSNLCGLSLTFRALSLHILSLHSPLAHFSAFQNVTGPSRYYSTCHRVCISSTRPYTPQTENKKLKLYSQNRLDHVTVVHNLRNSVYEEIARTRHAC